MDPKHSLKEKVAQAGLDFIRPGCILGVGTGSTVNCLIELLPQVKNKLEGCVASSKVTLAKLKALDLPILEPNSVSQIDLYLDGADEVDPYKHLIKGGGAALLGEKILAVLSQQFICLIDESKCVDQLGRFPLPVEVIPIARSMIARKLVKLGGHPVYREGVVTDFGNIILDVHHLTLENPLQLEQNLKQEVGLVESGLFAKRKADTVLAASQGGIKSF